MRQHALGLFLATVAFAFGVLAVPIRFESLGAASHFAKELEYSCSSENFVSPNLERVGSWSCSFDGGEESADHDFTYTLSKYCIVSATGERALVSYAVEDSVGYCVLRIESNRRTDICSRSLRALLAFENGPFAR